MSENDWREKFRPICELLEPLSISDRRILMHAIAYSVLEMSGGDRAVSIGEYSGVPVAHLFVRGARLTRELDSYATDIGLTCEREVQEIERDYCSCELCYRQWNPDTKKCETCGSFYEQESP